MKQDKLYYEEVHNLQLRSTSDNYFMYGYLLGVGVESVFEFGCNAGRHLKQLRKLKMDVYGIDLNKKAIYGGQALWELNIELGDESFLKKIPNSSYDACITISVLNHIENIHQVVEELKRIAKKYIIICETNTKDNNATKSPWYIHDYKIMGFKRIRSYYPGKADAIYTMYVMEL